MPAALLLYIPIATIKIDSFCLYCLKIMQLHLNRSTAPTSPLRLNHMGNIILISTKLTQLQPSFLFYWLVKKESVTVHIHTPEQ